MTANHPHIKRAHSLWQKTSNIVQRRFGIRPSIDLTDIEIADSPLRPDGHFSMGTLYITQKALNNEARFKGVIYRECFIDALPEGICPEAKRDFGMEFAYQSMSKSEQNVWVGSWKRIPVVTLSNNLEYNSYDDMDALRSRGGESILDQLVHEFIMASEYNLSPNLMEYVRTLTHRGQEITVRLIETDIKIIENLVRGKMNKEISDIIRKSEVTISKRKTELMEKRVLYEFTRVPWFKIGIRGFQVLFNTRSGYDPFEIIKDCPFLYTSQRVLSGEWQANALFAVPDNPECVQSLDTMRNSLYEMDANVEIVEVCSSGKNMSFKHYNTHTGAWNIPWRLMEKKLKHSIDTGSHLFAERIDTPIIPIAGEIDSIDIEILGILSYGGKIDNKLETVRSQLRINQNKAHERVKRIQEMGLIDDQYNVHGVGLTEQVIVRTDDADIANAIDVWARELPTSFHRYDIDRRMFMTLSLPIGGSYNAMASMRDVNGQLFVSPVYRPIWGDWKLPVHLWNVDTQQWNAPTEEINSWLDGMYERYRASVVQSSH